jgi:hypothetical protein
MANIGPSPAPQLSVAAAVTVAGHRVAGAYSVTARRPPCQWRRPEVTGGRGAAWDYCLFLGMPLLLPPLTLHWQALRPLPVLRVSSSVLILLAPTPMV